MFLLIIIRVKKTTTQHLKHTHARTRTLHKNTQISQNTHTYTLHKNKTNSVLIYWTILHTVKVVFLRTLHEIIALMMVL